VDHLPHDFARPGVADDAAIPRPAQGRDGIAGAIHHHFRPEIRFNVVRDQAGYPGPREQGHQFFHLAATTSPSQRIAEFKVATPVVLDASRRDHLDPHVDHGGEGFDPRGRVNSGDVVHAVLKTSHDRAGCQVWGQGTGRVLGVQRLHAQQDHFRPTSRAGLGGRRNRDLLLEMQALEVQPVPAHRLDVRGPSDERDRGAGPREQPAEVTADGARSHHGDFRPPGCLHAMTPD
jgi:hypothetical protein